MKTSDFEKYMCFALSEAVLTADSSDIPVGAVVVKNGEIIGRGHNTRERDGCAISHAEINAITDACKNIGSWRLDGCELYVTLEPCPMCAGAVINSRLSAVIFGAYDKKGGACGGVINLFEESFNHKPQVYGGVLHQKCEQLLLVFFKHLR